VVREASLSHWPSHNLWQGLNFRVRGWIWFWRLSYLFTLPAPEALAALSLRPTPGVAIAFAVLSLPAYAHDRFESVQAQRDPCDMPEPA
jgi:hypothetical protein